MKIDGLPVVDAKKKCVINIKMADVKSAKTKDPGACAAAKACLRATKVEQARVHIGRVYLLRGNKWERYLTPKALRSEIISFDRGAKFQPGVFTLYAPHPTAKVGKMQGSATGQRDKPKKKRAKYHIVSGVRQYGANR